MPTHDTEPEPSWTKQPRETIKAYGAFQTYLELGPQRSIRAVARKLSETRADKGLKSLGKNYASTLFAWSVKYDWVKRSQAWDEHMAEIARAQLEKARQDMIDRHANMGAAMGDVASAKLIDWRNKIQAWQADPEHNKLPDLSRRDVVFLVEAGTKLERLSRGEPTEHVEVRELHYRFIPPRRRPMPGEQEEGDGATGAGASGSELEAEDKSE